MCGIAGLWRLSGADPRDGERLERMAATLVHRGPDDFGYLLTETRSGAARATQDTVAEFVPDLLLASRRLSILDLTPAGRQPIGNEAGDVFAVFNGAIHNYVELRDELRARGHVFRSRTDTEVIVHAYEEWGEECARRFNGMWAYALWDARREQLVCSRDRFGIKPLVYANREGCFHFASEPKAILATGEIAAVPDPAFLRRFLCSNMPANGSGTAFAGITQLPPGHNLVLTRAGSRTAAYWSYIDRSEAYDFHRPEDTFEHLFVDALRLRLRSDVPYALLLSGGLDSSAIAVYAGEAGAGEGLEAFTVTFPAFTRDERRYAELVADERGIRLHCVAFDPADLMECLAAATWHMDAPPSLAQVLPRWRLLEAASRRARVVLEGQGVDEMLGGYTERYRPAYVRSELAQLSLREGHRALGRILVATTLLGRPTARRWVGRLVRGTLRPVRGEVVLSPALAAAPHSDDEPVVERPWFPDPLTRALHADHAHRMLPHLLHFGDALSMAHSVESRLPFLDHRLVEFVFGLPFDAKIRGRETKHVLRAAFAAKLPSRIRDRRDKIGFITPIGAWLRPRLRDEVLPLLRSRRTRERGVFDASAVDRLAGDVVANRRGAANLMFRCLALETWFRLFVDGEGLRGRSSAARRVLAKGGG